MSYLYNKKEKQRKFLNWTLVVFSISILFIFRSPIGRGLSLFAHAVASPFLSAKQGISQSANDVGLRLASKETLQAENDQLKKAVAELQLQNLERDILFNENIAMKESLGRIQNPAAFILGVILSKPPLSPYDTLVLDIGADMSVREGALVFAYGRVPIGTIAEVYPKSSLVKLFSTSGETTKVVVGGSNIQLDALGKGGGNFEVTLPREIQIAEGSEFSLPNISPQIVAIVRKVVSDPRDPFQKILAASPVTISQLKFVEIER